jgi:DNA-binding MarR family transcriptional regulator
MIRAVGDERAPDLLQELYSTGLLVGLLVDRELARLGVPRQLFSFLGWVSTLEPVTPGRLAAETGLPPTTVRDQIRRLIARGDVRRIPNPADGRSYLLVLTPRGRRVADRGWPAVVAAVAQLGANLDRPAGEYLPAARELRTAAKRALAEDDADRLPSGSPDGSG